MADRTHDPRQPVPEHPLWCTQDPYNDCMRPLPGSAYIHDGQQHAVEVQDDALGDPYAYATVAQRVDEHGVAGPTRIELDFGGRGTLARLTLVEALRYSVALQQAALTVLEAQP